VVSMPNITTNHAITYANVIFPKPLEEFLHVFTSTTRCISNKSGKKYLVDKVKEGNYPDHSL